eukprot:2573451-Rhodomonas_salina.1
MPGAVAGGHSDRTFVRSTHELGQRHTDCLIRLEVHEGGQRNPERDRKPELRSDACTIPDVVELSQAESTHAMHRRNRRERDNPVKSLRPEFDTTSPVGVAASLVVCTCKWQPNTQLFANVKSVGGVARKRPGRLEEDLIVAERVREVAILMLVCVVRVIADTPAAFPPINSITVVPMNEPNGRTLTTRVSATGPSLAFVEIIRSG